ncbi:uncharacterized protein LOC134206907 [Armigeres subalbatus]|uniref:uncharacterized protein LOC134206907 n=1 Tax=Armigeres subalbatus TaxID=124917 RepID=UPI002ED32F63
MLPQATWALINDRTCTIITTREIDITLSNILHCTERARLRWKKSTQLERIDSLFGRGSNAQSIAAGRTKCTKAKLANSRSPPSFRRALFAGLILATCIVHRTNEQAPSHHSAQR